MKKLLDIFRFIFKKSYNQYSFEDLVTFFMDNLENSNINVVCNFVLKNNINNRLKSITNCSEVVNVDISTMREIKKLDEVDLLIIDNSNINLIDFEKLKKLIGISKVVVFKYENVFKSEFTNFSDLNTFFNTKNFQLFSVVEKKLISLYKNDKKFDNMKGLDLIGVQKRNILKIFSQESGNSNFYFRYI
tara:strand:+ start:95 stop:661 length:567 start_codon:yes stop_codon:yes gene_type:complete